VSVAPDAVAAAAKADAIAQSEGAQAQAQAHARETQAQAEAQARREAEEQERTRLETEAAAAAASASGADSFDAGGMGGEAVGDLEDQIALQLRAHTESWQGKKDSQEDRVLDRQRLGKLGTAFGVFDGHGGVHAAEYVAKHLTGNVVRCWQKQKGSSKDMSDSAAGAKKLVAALQEAFDVTDRDLLQLARRKKYKDGTTALLLLFGGTDVNNLLLYTANLGDCRAVLCRGGLAVRLTEDHRPDRKDEQKRIKAAGGGCFEMCGIWRCCTAAGAARATSAHAGFSESDTNTYLSCSRTFGDPELKMNADRPILSNVPEVEVRKLQVDDLFVLTACDGVWDVLTDQQAVDLVLQHWGDPAAAASTIVRSALNKGSGDNVTAQVIMFGWRAAEGKEAKTLREAARLKEEEEARKPKEKVLVQEDDLDMFS